MSDVAPCVTPYEIATGDAVGRRADVFDLRHEKLRRVGNFAFDAEFPLGWNNVRWEG